VNFESKDYIKPQVFGQQQNRIEFYLNKFTAVLFGANDALWAKSLSF